MCAFVVPYHVLCPHADRGDSVELVYPTLQLSIAGCTSGRIGLIGLIGLIWLIWAYLAYWLVGLMADSCRLTFLVFVSKW